VLLAKLEQVGSLGVRRFALLLDDLPPELAHDDDRAVFADITEAHAALACAVAAGLGPERRLSSARSSTTAAATSRTSPGSAPRSTRASTSVDRARDLLADARGRGRPPVRGHRRPPAAVLGQLPGQRRRDGLGAAHRAVPRSRRGPRRRRRAASREPDGAREASKIPLATIADYLADPAGYDPEASVAARSATSPGRHPTAAPTRGVRDVRRERPQQLPVTRTRRP
jgi:hyaluronoglucosaminidase